MMFPPFSFLQRWMWKHFCCNCSATLTHQFLMLTKQQSYVAVMDLWITLHYVFVLNLNTYFTG